MKQAFCLVREHLGTTAERMKRRYDLRVRPQQFRRGQWVLYYNPQLNQKTLSIWSISVFCWRLLNNFIHRIYGSIKTLKTKN